jgi:hypothetical protein
MEENELSFSLQSVSALIGANKAFINNKGDVDVGEIKEVTICEEGILKVKIKGEKTATVCMEQVFENAKEAYKVSIKLKHEQRTNLNSDISAIKGRIDNLDNPSLD